MSKTNLVFLFILFTFNHISGKDKTICLNMIVKNESHVIERCLKSVKPLIDYWVIVDTGSTDGTQEIIKNFMSDVPGELYESPWVDFAHNRNEALQLAKDKADYALFLDADDQYVIEDGFSFPETLDKDYYNIVVHHGTWTHKRPELIKTSKFWEWRDVLHEAICPLEGRSGETLKGIFYLVNTDGARSQDSTKFLKDIEVLKKALEKEPNHRRYAFYLAQSYKDAGLHEEAIQAYERRIKMGGWDQEIFWSLLQIAHLKEWLNRHEAEVIAAYKRAYYYRPSRVEPLYHAAHYHLTRGNYHEGYRLAKKGLKLKKNDDILFIDSAIYDYQLLLDFSLCAFYTGQIPEAYLASNLLLTKENIPPHVRRQVEINITQFIEPMLVDF